MTSNDGLYAWFDEYSLDLLSTKQLRHETLDFHSTWADNTFQELYQFLSAAHLTR